MRSALGILIALVAFAAAPARAQIDFSAPRAFRAGVASRDVALADFDRDGALDAAVANEFGDDVALLVGDGLARFLAPILRPVGSRPVAIEVGDFDGNGEMDAAVAHRGGASIAVLQGDGLGGFAAPVVVPTGVSPRSLVVGDWNGDGLDDVATGDFTSETITVILADGHGAFDPAGSLVAGHHLEDIAAADIDGDGTLDLASPAGSGAAVRVFAGLGDGSFASSILVESGSFSAEIVEIGDLDGDGHADVVAANRVQYSVLLGDGALGFALGDAATWGTTTNFLTLGDLDGDGALDVAGTTNIASLAIHRGAGDGSFGPLEELRHGFLSRDLSIGDLDGDGRADVAAATSAIGALVVFRSDSDGRYPAASRTAAGRFPAETVAADFDGDAHADVALISSGTAEILALRGDGSGALALVSATPVRTPVALATADFDEDGLPDLAVSTAQIGAADDIRLLHSDGALGFTFGTSADVIERAFSVAATDLDADGHADVVASDEGGGGRIVAFLGDGAGSLAESSATSVPRDPRIADVADFDADSHGDVATRDASALAPEELVIAFGDGAGGFARTAAADSGFVPRAASALDADSDGSLDLVVSSAENASTGEIAFLGGDGTGAFSVPEPMTLEWGPVGALRVRDFDEDGRLDIAAEHAFGILFLGGRPGARWVEETLFLVPFGVHPPVVADLDEDGHADVVGTQVDTDSITILRNRTDFGGYDCRRGDASVLFVNGLRGDGPARRLAVDRNAPFRMRMKALDADPDGVSPFACFAWAMRPVPGGAVPLPFGEMGLDPLAARRTWNNTGDPQFGAPDLPSSPAPSVVLTRLGGVRKRLTFYVQAVMADEAAPFGYVVTNGIEIDSR